MQAAVMDTWCVVMFRREKIELNFIYKAPNHSRVQISFQADSVCKCSLHPLVAVSVQAAGGVSPENSAAAQTLPLKWAVL